MELTVAVIISILSIVFTILNFVFSRGDKSNKDTADRNYRQGILDQQLKTITEKLEKIERKLDKYEEEIDARVEKAIANHVKTYHSRKSGGQ